MKRPLPPVKPIYDDEGNLVALTARADDRGLVVFDLPPVDIVCEEYERCDSNLQQDET